MSDLGEIFHDCYERLFNGIDEINIYTNQTLMRAVAGAQLLGTHISLSREAADRSAMLYVRLD
jgi:hypothetical protein